VVPPAGVLGDEFYGARPRLVQVRDAAHAMQRSAGAVLQAVLARVAAFTPPTVEIPAVVGAPAPLCWFAVLLAPPGVGKSSAKAIGSRLVPVPAGRAMHVVDDLPIGSGEGLVDALFEMVEEPTANGGTRMVKTQTRSGVFVFVDEGRVVADIAARKGSVLLPTLRTAWSGATLGQSNATAERRRVVPAGGYTLGVLLALQDALAGLLLADADAGTPQRFAWARATDPTIPDVPPVWPGPLRWEPPCCEQLAAIGIPGPDGQVRHPLRIAAPVVDEIRAADVARARGETLSDPYDSHAGLVRLKCAALLALLDDRVDVTVDDWTLAGMVVDASDAVRAEAQAITTAASEAQERATSARLARRSVDADEARERRQVVNTAGRIADVVRDKPGITVGELRRRLSSRQREVLEDALRDATAEHRVTERDEPGRGPDRRALYPGPENPQ
jgi:hypothetical protein